MLDKAKSFLQQVLDLGLLLIGVAVVLQIIFGNVVPFVGGDIVGNILKIVKDLGDGGLVGLIAAGLILYVINKRA
jgi:phosphotransferase system  glucose/maltose/N-acetylglucosamine-specific IIC component